jgi:predicted metalloprotease with PDZ domain
MMRSTLTAAICCAASTLIAANASPGPHPATIAPATAGAIAAPQDRAYPGDIRISVDASDADRRIVRVHETLTGFGPDTVLLYPQWLPGTHSPEGPIDRFAGLRISANGAPVAWKRDPLNVYAFRVRPAAGINSIDIEFDYLSPTSPKVADMEISRDMLFLDWNTVILYPAGYFARQIPVQASLTLPLDWKFGSALEVQSSSGAETTFKRSNLETLVDSPVYAGRYAARLDLDPGSATPVHLDLFADRQELLAVKPEQLQAYRDLVQQAYRLYGSHHYAHYDFLYSLSDQIYQKGLEHQQSSENGSEPDSFTEWDKNAPDRDLLPHEFTHSWNGKFRRPADLWTPNYNVPMQDSLLWVYEGQTQYWGEVLAARCGLWTKQQALDSLAETAAYYEHQAGRSWRALLDTTNDEIINPRRPMSWRDWQRFEDYYDEGRLIWLEVDTLIRERSQGKRSLDDFARAFFGIDDGSPVTVTYSFEDVVKALNAVEPYDWSAFLRERVDGVARPAPLEGLSRGGYRLLYTDTPSEFEKAGDLERKRISLRYSIGIVVDEKDGTVSQVAWNSPAFKATLTESAQILAVNGTAYAAEVLKDAIRSAKGTALPIELIVKTGDHYRVIAIDYHGGLRYPHLERDAAVPARLDDILAAKK